MRKILIVIFLITIVILAFGPCDTSVDLPATMDIEGTVDSTVLYTSRTTINGVTTVSYATGIFLENGYYFHFAGTPVIEPGRYYHFTIVPDGCGYTWDELINIEMIY